MYKVVDFKCIVIVKRELICYHAQAPANVPGRKVPNRYQKQ